MRSLLLMLIAASWLVAGAVGCDEGNTVDDACNHVCDCLVAGGAYAPSERPYCFDGCRQNRGYPTQECIDCEVQATCQQIWDFFCHPTCGR
jgi:hypothetical protein